MGYQLERNKVLIIIDVFEHLCLNHILYYKKEVENRKNETITILLVHLMNYNMF